MICRQRPRLAKAALIPRTSIDSCPAGLGEVDCPIRSPVSRRRVSGRPRGHFGKNVQEIVSPWRRSSGIALYRVWTKRSPENSARFPRGPACAAAGDEEALARAVRRSTATGSSGWSTCGSAAGCRAGSTIRTCSRRRSSRSPAGCDEYAREPTLPFFLWLRHMTGAEAGRGPPPPPRHPAPRRRSRGHAPPRRPAAGRLGLAGGPAPGHADHALAGRHQGRDPPARAGGA